ncbi:HTH_Tnp_Tc3_2 domain-containing protein [Trichonephila clavipes]|nr:HTH_Tnp_Tc3_2 domain-containing protein [Trichonephila clavipes]
MCLNKEIVQPVPHTQISFQRCYLGKAVVMPRVRSRNAYQHVPDFDKGRIVVYQDCGLSYRSIAARVGRDPMIVGRIQYRWVQDGNTERRAGSQRPPINRRRKDRHVTRVALMYHAAMARTLSQELETFAGQVVTGLYRDFY